LWAATGAAAASRADRRSMEREGWGTCKGRRGRVKASCRDQEPKAIVEALKQVLRPAWLMCAKTLPLAGLLVPT
jgi:hypothetical protein